MFSFSQHALTRIRQRGLRESDVSVVVEAGTPVDDESVLLLGQDVDREIRKHKQKITELERLRGCRVVIVGEIIVTVYRPSRKTEKRMLRGQNRHRTKRSSDETKAISTSNGDQSKAD